MSYTKYTYKKENVQKQYLLQTAEWRNTNKTK